MSTFIQNTSNILSIVSFLFSHIKLQNFIFLGFLDKTLE